MKRLIRKAISINWDDFFYNLLNEEYSTYIDMVDQIKNENQDCLYSGEVFRVVFFEEEDVKKSIKRFQDVIIVDNEFTDELFNLVIRDLVKVRDYEQSCSKSLRGVDFYRTTSYHQTDFSITIKFNTSSALDVGLLINKYKDDVSDYTYKQYAGEYKSEEEVLSIVDSNFEVVQADAIYEEVYNIAKDKM